MCYYVFTPKHDLLCCSYVPSRAFDVLFVVDPHRSWYCGGEPQALQHMYRSRLQQYTQQYNEVIMIGDSMGATASLLFSDLATYVLAFCPQVGFRAGSWGFRIWGLGFRALGFRTWVLMPVFRVLGHGV